MKISGSVGSGTVFSVEISSAGSRLIAESVNQSPEGLSVEEEMKQYLTTYLSALELAFVAREPARRVLVNILEEGTVRTFLKLVTTFEKVTTEVT